MTLEIEIQGQKVGLRYGTLHAEMIETALLKGEVMSATADFFPLFFYAAYVNYCRVTDAPLTLKKSDFYLWFEGKELAEINPYIEAWEGTKGKERWDKLIGAVTSLTDEQKKSIGGTQSDTASES